MGSLFFKCLILLIAGLIVSTPLKSQICLSLYTDEGVSNISRGFYAKTSIEGGYHLAKSTFEAGSQADIRYSSHKIITGFNFIFTQELSIKKYKFDLQGFLLVNPFSKLIHESDWGILLKSGQKHFRYMAGIDFRTYKITREAMDKYEIESNTSLHEYWNFVYLLGYNLKPIDNRWNIGLSATNFDHFLINQETNPMLYLRGHYQISSELTLFSEVWYKNAGVFNIYANYFGFFIRTGITWKLNLKK